MIQNPLLLHFRSQNNTNYKPMDAQQDKFSASLQSGDGEYYGFKQEAIINNETILQITLQQMSKKQHKNVVAILWTLGTLIGRGTGLLISQNLILTCAHILYVGKNKLKDACLEVYAGPRENGKQFYQIEWVYIPKKFSKSPSESMNDYALIKLSEKVEKANQFIPLNDEFIFNKKQENKIAIYGYPSRSYKKKDNKIEISSITQWGMTKAKGILKVKESKGQIIHLISTQGGHSGSPIILVEGERLSVIGIHLGSCFTKKNGQQIAVNQGRLLTQKLIDKLLKYAKEMQADTFKTTSQENNPRLWKLKELYRFCKKAKISSTDAEGHFKIAIALSDVNQMKEAINYYRKVIGINPSHQNAYFNLGNALLEQNRIEQAIQCYQKLLEINPKDEGAFYNLGNALYSSNRMKEAIECYKKALEIELNFGSAYIRLGAAYEADNQAEEAIKCYRLAIQISPLDQLAHVNLGDVLCSVGNFKEAVECYKRAIKIKPKFSEVYDMLGNAYEQSKDMQSALSYYHQAVQLSPKNSLFKNNFNRALQYFRKTNRIAKGFESHVKDAKLDQT